jgi:hypothetical protein
MSAKPRTHAEALADPTPEWIVMHCLDAFRDASGQPGEHKVPLAGYERPMSYREAWDALRRIEAGRPGEDFSIRRVAGVLPFTAPKAS